MTGTKNKKKPTDEMCPNCGLYYSKRGIIPHRRNCDRDEPLLPLDRDDDDGGDGPDDKVTPEASTPTDGVGDGAPPEGSTPSSDPARTDGAGLGLEGPPETSTDGGRDDHGDLPDRYVSVDEYLDACRAKGLSESRVAQLREALEEYDVVDVQKTTEDHLAASTLEEVTDE
jgi:hypothetical protein